MSYHRSEQRKMPRMNSGKRITVALAGNANVGKSVIFNHLTGLHQHIGNWPGKTVEKAEGTLSFGDYIIDVIDLPGIYSLSTFSIEETIALDYILYSKPDIVINVVDASNLERNLYFTIQLLETEVPLIIALNQIDMAILKGIMIDNLKLEELLGVPVVPMVAVRGVGFEELMRKVIETYEEKVSKDRPMLTYGDEVELRIKGIVQILSGKLIDIPSRFAAIRLLEGDELVRQKINEISKEAIQTAEAFAAELEKIHGHSIETIISSERYSSAKRIADRSQRIFAIKPQIRDKIDDLTARGILGYLLMVAVLTSLFIAVFKAGDFISGIFDGVFASIKEVLEPFIGFDPVSQMLWAATEGVLAGVSLAVAYLVPFYIFLGILEDSGYLARMAFMMDNIMHVIGFHGKAIIPLMLGYGCNVPACLSCRIMESKRDRIILAFLVTLVPCAARTLIILGLVGRFVGMEWAFAIYALNVVVIFLLGRMSQRILPGESMGLIIEVPPYRLPHPWTVAKRTWFQARSYLQVAIPLIFFGSILLKGMELFGVFEPLGLFLSPITVEWLRLPAIVGVLLIFGVLRKELTLIMLAAITGTTNFSTIMSKSQMITFSIVTMFYIPCVATVAALHKELGLRRASIITISEIAFAIFLGGIFAHFLPPIY